MNRRRGVTLIEVLVAIFVMAIGLIALLTLFPLGALNMAQAIKDDKVAHAAETAMAVSEARAARDDALVTPAYDNPDPGQTFKLPDLSTLPVGPGLPPYDGPSYPVLIDPFGVYSSFFPASQWVAGGAAPPNLAANPPTPGFGVARRSLAFIDQPAANRPIQSMRWFTLLDDINFVETAQPDLSTGAVQRESTISWAFLARRPRRSIPSVVDVSIVVYNKRPLRLTTGLNPKEDAYAAVYDTTQNVIQLTWTTQQPTLRAGDWVLDATIEPFNGRPRPHGFFYRLTDVNATGAKTLELRVATPFREFTPGGQYNGVVMVLDGVSEVIEKRSGWRP
jgi:prepilin-type N-terminal cleavage/methylation domain-containing protein